MIAGLKDALAAEMAAENTLATVAQRLNDARLSLAAAHRQRTLSIAKAAGGEPVKAAAVEQAITAADSAVAVFTEALGAAEARAATSSHVVTSLLRRELRKREVQARAEFNAAEEAVAAAVVQRRAADERLSAAVRTAALPGELLRVFLSSEIDECEIDECEIESTKEKAPA